MYAQSRLHSVMHMWRSEHNLWVFALSHHRGSVDQAHISALVSKHFALSESSCQPQALFCLLDFHEIKHKLYRFLFSGKVNLTLAIWEIRAWFPSYWSNCTSAIVQKNCPDLHIKPEIFVCFVLSLIIVFQFFTETWVSSSEKLSLSRECTLRGCWLIKAMLCISSFDKNWIQNISQQHWLN